MDIKISFNARGEGGFILVMVMLFLSIFSLFAFSILEIGLLENKMSIAWQDKVKAFYLAEKYLSAAEKQISEGGLPINAEEINSGIFGKSCGIKFYRLIARADVRGAESVLQSVFATKGDVDECVPKPNITAGRQSFCILS